MDVVFEYMNDYDMSVHDNLIVKARLISFRTECVWHIMKGLTSFRTMLVEESSTFLQTLDDGTLEHLCALTRAAAMSSNTKSTTLAFIPFLFSL